jgi:hypothetical protein
MYLCMQHFIDACVLFICSDEPGGSSNANSLALMEFYMKKAAQEEKFKQPRHSKDEMPPPPSLQGSTFDGDCYLVFIGLAFILFEQLSCEFSLCKCNNLLITLS